MTIDPDIDRNRKKRITRATAAVCCLAALAVYVQHRNRDRYMRLEGSLPLHYTMNDAQEWRHGLACDVNWPTEDGHVIECHSPTERVARNVLHEQPGWFVTLASCDDCYANGTIVYAAYQRRRPSALRKKIQLPYILDGIKPGVLFMGTKFAGAFLYRPTIAQIPANVKRSVLPRMMGGGSSSTEILPAKIRSVNISTGAVEDLGLMESTNPTLSGNIVYWLKVLPDDVVRISSPRVTVDEVAGNSELWATSLKDRSSKCIRTGRPGDTSLHPSHSGVFWTELNTYPDTRLNLWYCPNVVQSAVCVKDFTGDTSHAWPVEVNGKLFWFSKPGTPLADPNRWQPTELVSANIDGSNQQITPIGAVGDLTIDQWNGNNDWGPHVYGNQLYCLMCSNTYTKPPYQNRVSLCRIDPGRSVPFEVVYQLPIGAAFGTLDEGYIYFNLSETHYKNIWSSIIGGNTDSKDILNMYRARLPAI